MRSSPSERLFIEELTHVSKQMKAATKNLSIGALIKTIRTQLGMPQKVLAKRAGVPQSTVSRIEQGKRDVNLSTIYKILGALSCDLVIAPLLHDSIDAIRKNQARRIAQKHIVYIEGTMNLEKQQPDSQFIEELLKQEEQRLLQGPNTKLWKE